MILLGNYSAWNMLQSTLLLPNRNRGNQAMPLSNVQRWHPDNLVCKLQGWFYLHLNKKLPRSKVRAGETSERSSQVRAKTALCPPWLCTAH